MFFTSQRLGQAIGVLSMLSQISYCMAQNNNTQPHKNADDYKSAAYSILEIKFLLSVGALLICCCIEEPSNSISLRNRNSNRAAEAHAL